MSLRPLAAAFALLILCAPVVAQGDAAGVDSETEPQPWVAGDPGAVEWRIDLAGQYQFESDIDAGGKFSLGEFEAGAVAYIKLSDTWQLRVGGQLRWEHYDFSGSGGLGAINPWSDIFTIGAGAVLNWKPVDDFELLFGPVIQFSAETGADLTDGFIGGGLVAGAWRVSETLTLGGGFGIVSQIEDSALWFPVIIVDWQFTDTLKLTSRTGAAAFTRAGFELVWDFADDWQLGIGGGYDFRRFRLDDGGAGGIGDEGVGEFSRLPLYARVGWQMNDNVTLEFYAGVALSGYVRLDDSTGAKIAKESYDPAPMLRGQVRIRF